MKRTSKVLGVAGVGLTLLAASTRTSGPVLVWNRTYSVPVGLYRIAPSLHPRGEMAAVCLPAATAAFAAGRGYLPAKVLLLKPIAAVRGDRVCRWNASILINGRRRAVATVQDRAGRAMPVWRGCRLLAEGDLFLMSASRDSFDSRYFGIISTSAIIGRAIPLWTR